MLNTEHCEEYLAKVRAKADELGMRDRLEKQLNYLATYACQEDPEHTRCDLFNDFAPLSFFFRMYVKGQDGQYKEWFIGGLIFFNRGDSGVGSPQFSCRLDASEAGWSINT